MEIYRQAAAIHCLKYPHCNRRIGKAQEKLPFFENTLFIQKIKNIL